jgi:hypothetical protein
MWLQVRDLSGCKGFNLIPILGLLSKIKKSVGDLTPCPELSLKRQKVFGVKASSLKIACQSLGKYPRICEVREIFQKNQQ